MWRRRLIDNAHSNRWCAFTSNFDLCSFCHHYSFDIGFAHFECALVTTDYRRHWNADLSRAALKGTGDFYSILECDIGDIGNTIQEHVEAKGFSVVRDFCGHGIGKNFHEPPNILHYGKKNTGIELKSGMIFTVEPMINEGKYEVSILKDGWTAVTKDKTFSAQFEHTVGVTENGFEIFTKSKKKYEKPPYSI